MNKYSVFGPGHKESGERGRCLSRTVVTTRPVGTTGRKNQPCPGGQGGFMEEEILGRGSGRRRRLSRESRQRAFKEGGTCE